MLTITDAAHVMPSVAEVTTVARRQITGGMRLALQASADERATILGDLDILLNGALDLCRSLARTGD